jgi:hypothetical protein
MPYRLVNIDVSEKPGASILMIKVIFPDYSNTEDGSIEVFRNFAYMPNCTASYPGRLDFSSAPQ